MMGTSTGSTIHFSKSTIATAAGMVGAVLLLLAVSGRQPVATVELRDSSTNAVTVLQPGAHAGSALNIQPVVLTEAPAAPMPSATAEPPVSHPTAVLDNAEKDDLQRKYGKSAGNQDRWVLDNIFPENHHWETGVFIEFGARDGVEHSNTHLFEKAFGWRGVMAEALPSEHKDIVRNRPGAVIIDGAICESRQHVEFLHAPIPGWGGRADTYDTERSGSSQLAAASKLRVPCLTLGDVIETFGIHHVNYLSADTEGSELQALKGFPWEKVLVDVVGVETLLGGAARDAKRKELDDFMATVGYEVKHVLKFADDTADVFYTPKGYVKKKLASTVPSIDDKKFKNNLDMCKALMRCLS